jgi:hypothetical protein
MFWTSLLPPSSDYRQCTGGKFLRNIVTCLPVIQRDTVGGNNIHIQILSTSPFTVEANPVTLCSVV